MFSNRFLSFGGDTGQLGVGNPFTIKIIQPFAQFMQAPTVKGRDSEIPPTGCPSREKSIAFLILLELSTIMQIYYFIRTYALQIVVA